MCVRKEHLLLSRIREIAYDKAMERNLWERVRTTKVKALIRAPNGI